MSSSQERDLTLRDVLESLAATLSVPRCWELAELLRGQDDLPPDRVEGLVWAFSYQPTAIKDDDSSHQEAFCPAIEMQQCVFPPPLSDVEDSRLNEWAGLANSESPVVASRLNHLLWERRWGAQSHEHARRAIRAYLELGQGNWEGLDRADALRLGMDLAMSLNAPDLVARVVEAAAVLAQHALDDPDLKPGLMLITLRLLAGAPDELVPTSLDAQLEAACAVSVGNPFVYPALMDLRIGRAASDPLTGQRLKTEHVQQVLLEAEAQSGAGRHAQLRLAHGLAARYGLTDKRREIETMIQAMRPEDLELQVFESETSVPRSDYEAYMSFFTDAGSWQEALGRFAAQGVPLQDKRTAQLQTEEMCRGLVFPHICASTLYGPTGLPIRTYSTYEENMALTLARNEAIFVDIWGLHGSRVLDAIEQKYGRPSLQELTDFYTTDYVDDLVAERIAKSMHLYWDGEYDLSAHVITPRIERVVRGLCEDIGLVVYRPPNAGQDGYYQGLGILLRNMLDLGVWGDVESWGRYLLFVLADPTGRNLRNYLCHGINPVAGQADAALLIHVASLLRLVRRLDCPTDAGRREPL